MAIATAPTVEREVSPCRGLLREEVDVLTAVFEFDVGELAVVLGTGDVDELTVEFAAKRFRRRRRWKRRPGCPY